MTDAPHNNGAVHTVLTALGFEHHRQRKAKPEPGLYEPPGTGFIDVYSGPTGNIYADPSGVVDATDVHPLKEATEPTGGAR